MSTHKLHLIIVLWIIICCLNISAQENSLYINSYNSPFVNNAGCTGAEYYPVANFSVRKTLLDFPDAPATYLIYANIRLGQHEFYNSKYFLNKGRLKYSDRIGLGAAIYHDKNGPLKNTGGLLSYAYHIPINQESRLSLGLSMLFANYSCNTEILKPGEENDNYLLEGNENKNNLNFGFGIYYYNRKYFGGISVNKLLPGVSNAGGPNKMAPSYFAVGGYKFNSESDIFIYEPSIEIKKLPDENLILDFRNKIYVNRLNWLAISMSTSRIMNVQLGIRIYRMTYIGYSYGIITNRIVKYTNGIHELSIGINLGLTGIEKIRATL